MFYFKFNRVYYFLRIKEDYNHEFDEVTVMSEVFPDDTLNILRKNSNSAHTAPVLGKNYSTNGQQNKLINFSLSNMKQDDEAASQRVKNYQRLSHSINDLFANLLEQLEKQKNKNYLNVDTKMTSSVKKPHQDNHYVNLNQTDYLVNESLNKLNNEGIAFANKKQNLSKDSNKDSGFNQEFINDPSYRNKYYGEKKQDKTDLKEKRLQIIQADPDSNEISLLERYLNNEQLIAFKHSQLEAYLVKTFSNSFSDFAMIDYMLNQEGLSKTTFKKLIREKFWDIDWPNEVIMKLHEIINQTGHVDIDEDENLDGGFNDDFENDFESAPQLRNDYLNEKHLNSEKLNMFLKQKLNEEKVYQDESYSPSTTSSSRSYKKLKDIKASTTNQRRKTGEHSVEMLKSNLPNSFLKRRERKGSLPEINSHNLTGFDNINNSGVYPQDASDTAAKCNESTLSNRSRNTLAACKRHSRKSAFVLEAMRTSMFRSKSLTDLNSSIVKLDKNVTPSKSSHKSFNMNSNTTLNTNSGADNSTFNASKAFSNSGTLINSIDERFVYFKLV